MASKSTRQARKNQQSPAPPPPANSGGRRWIVLGLCLIVAGGATWAFMEFVVWSKVPAELVGKWEVVDGPTAYKDAEFQFSRNGNMKGHFNLKGIERPIDAQVRVEGDKLYITTRRPSPPYDEHVSIQTIRALNDGEFVVVDERGDVIKMARMR